MFNSKQKLIDLNFIVQIFLILKSFLNTERMNEHEFGQDYNFPLQMKSI